MTNSKIKTTEVCDADHASGVVSWAGDAVAGVFAALFGGFLGLTLLKFGNPVIAEKWPEMNLPGLDPGTGEGAPHNIYEFLLSPNWPIAWAYWGLGIVALFGLVVFFGHPILLGGKGPPLPNPLLPGRRGRDKRVLDGPSVQSARPPDGIRNPRNWLAALPLAWLLWELIAGSSTLDRGLSQVTVAHFAASVACFYLGFFCLSRIQSMWLFWSGILCGFILVLAVGLDQHFGGLERFRQFFFHQQELYGQGQPIPATLLKKINSTRIYSTLFYPNALAGALLLLLPPLLACLPRIRGAMAPSIRAATVRERPRATISDHGFAFRSRYPQIIGLTLMLTAAAWLYLASDSKVSLIWLLVTGFGIVAGAPTWFLIASLGAGSLACLTWSGSKGGWLLMLLLGLIALLRLRFPGKYKAALVLVLLALGLTGFFCKNKSFFQKGATSVVARFDYWDAAIQTAVAHPLLGTGPGTFFIAYEKVKKSESEPARLAHNDYLEQASDSGLPGFCLYAALILGGLFWTRPRSSDLDEGANVPFRGLFAQGGSPEVPFRGRFGTNWCHFALWLGLLGWALQSFFEFGLYIPALAWPAFTLLGWLLARRDD